MKKEITAVVIIILLIALNIYQFVELRGAREELTEMSQTKILGLLEPVDWTNPEKPAASLPVGAEDVPKSAVKLSVSSTGFTPDRFKVRAGEEVTLALTATDSVFVLKFKDPGLAAVAIGVGSGETKLIRFYAPPARGAYELYVDMPGRGDLRGAMEVE
jgi:plastocyanin